MAKIYERLLSTNILREKIVFDESKEKDPTLVWFLSLQSVDIFSF